MLGKLKFSTQMYDHLSPAMELLVKDFVSKGVVRSMIRNDPAGNIIFTLEHPDFIRENPDTVYMLYLGNRLNRDTMVMEARILHLDEVCRQGKLEPVKYYNG